MNTVDAMNAYIQRTKMKEKQKSFMRGSEIQATYDLVCRGKVFEAIILTFNYGRAKGYRMAKRELRHG